MKQEDFILLTYKNKGKHSGQIETLVQGKKQNPYNQIKWDQVVYTKQNYPLFYELFEKQYTPKNKYVITEKELENPIIFEDSAVEEIIVNRFGTGGEITFKQAAQVTNEQLEGLFNSNTTITKFNEFVFFTGITKISISDDGELSKTNSPFRMCSLQEITLPETVTDLGYRAFDNCKNIIKINFDNIVRFGFSCCQYLGLDVKLVIKLPSYMEVYGSNTNVGSNTYGYELIEGNHLYIKCLNGKSRSLLNCNNKVAGYYTNGKPFSITLEAETVDENTFYQCTNITDIEFIGLKKFNNMNNIFRIWNLRKIIIPDTCENQGGTDNMFFDCYNVEEVKLSNNPKATVIPTRFLANSKKYINLYIPDNIQEIQDAAFGGGNGTKKLKRIYIGTGITNIGARAFGGSYNLEEVTIKAVVPPTLHQDAFRNCNNTFKIYVPKESVEAYKTASVWSNYADRIFGIEEETN